MQITVSIPLHAANLMSASVFSFLLLSPNNTQIVNISAEGANSYLLCLNEAVQCKAFRLLFVSY